MTKKEYNNRDLQMENRLTRVEQIVNEIKDNHLVHMDKKIDDYNLKTNDKIDRLLWFIASSAFGAAISLIYIIVKIQ